MSEHPDRTQFFAVLPGADFAREFAQGFRQRFADSPPRLIAETLILTNSERTQRLLEETLADTAPCPGPLPRIRAISQLHADPTSAIEVPKAIAPIRRQLRLTRLVEAFLQNRRNAGEPAAPMSAAADLARSLTLLIDQMHDEGINPASLERALGQTELAQGIAAHWQQNLTFIDIVRENWPAILNEYEGGAIDPRARQYSAIEDLLERWSGKPPAAPVIAAGSTGSVASTARLLLGVAALPQGSVVLPGFDPALDPAIWDAVTPDHPMGPFHRWMHPAGLSPSAVNLWHDGHQGPRNGIVAQALRPAPVTDHWHAAATILRSGVAKATANLSLIEAESSRIEAAAIAAAMREAIQTPKHRVTLITPDASLARRVTAHLSAYDIVPDDTSGKPLSQTPPTVLMHLILTVASGAASAVDWAALLVHPLLQPGLARNDHLSRARKYDRLVLRQAHLKDSTVLPDVPDDIAEHHPELPDWVTVINRMLAPFAALLRETPSLAEILRTHCETAEALTAGAPDAGSAPRIWDDSDQRNPAGPSLHDFLQRLNVAADAFGDDPVIDYSVLLRGLMQGETLRPRPRQPHPRVAIRGPREARIESADTVILAGLIEGTWPEAPDPGPWLSRPMYEALGLPLPERSVGLSSHDFQQAICQPRVILSRARKIDGAPSVASRWLIRLQTLISGIGEEEAWRAMRARGDMYIAVAERLAKPEMQVPRAPRPAPRLNAIPGKRHLSVTQVETLIRDAYSVYAQRILRLSPLDPLSRTIDARDRGNVMHAIMEHFAHETRNWPGRAEAKRILLQTADVVLAAQMPQADLRRVWRARILRFAEWFITQEDERRMAGTPEEMEVEGQITLDLPNGPLTIRAKADRIDRLSDGSAAIYDYKTGIPPTEKQIGVYNHQLHLQAAILAAGGFRNLPSMQATEGAYIGLTGSGDGGKETRPEDLVAEMPTVMERLLEMLSKYDTGAPWTALGRPHLQAFESDYDHLSRRDEWSGEDGT